MTPSRTGDIDQVNAVSAYVNLMEEGGERVRDGYGSDERDRPKTLKRTWPTVIEAHSLRVIGCPDRRRHPKPRGWIEGRTRA